MAEYFITPEGIRASQRLVLKRSLPFYIVLLAAGCYYCYQVSPDQLPAAALTLLLLVVLLPISRVRTARQQHALLQSYRLLVEPGSISRFQLATPTIQLAASDIKQITQNTEGWPSVVSHDQHSSIYVPPYVTDYEQLLAELSVIAPVTTVASKPLLTKLAPFISVATLGLLGTFWLTTSKVLSTVLGIFLVSTLSWSAWHIWRNKNMTQQIRRVLWYLPLIILLILALTIARLRPQI